MRKLLAGLLAVAVLAPAARAQVPNFNKRGTGEKDEKAFVESVAQNIVKTARMTAKDITLQEYKFKGKDSAKTELQISAGYKGAALRTKYTADITVNIDSTNKDKWVVKSIDYKDNNKSPVKPSQQKLDALVTKFNNAD